MTPASVHDLLDDAAGRALDRARVAPPTVVDATAAVVAAAGRRRAAVRRRLTLAAVAAAVALVLTLAAGIGPWGLGRPVPADPGRPLGLPDHWTTPPTWTRTYTDSPIAAASLLLETDVARERPGADRSFTVDGVVAVSADGRAYRRLPAQDGAVGFALSPSGRRVAWLDTGSADLAGPATLVALDLATGAVMRVRLPGGAGPAAVTWLPDEARLAVTGVDGGGQTGWLVGLGGSVAVRCRCATDGLFLADPEGRQVVVGSDAEPVGGAVALGVGGSVAVALGARVPTATGLAPDGRRAARVTPDGTGRRELEIVSDVGVLRHALPPAVSDVRVVAWTSAGILLTRLPGSGGSASGLWLVDPVTFAVRQVSDGDTGRARVVSVATALVPRPVVRADAPDRSVLSRDYLRHRVLPVAVDWIRAPFGTTGRILVVVLLTALGLVAFAVRGTRGKRWPDGIR